MKVSPAKLSEMKRRGEKIAALTAYDFITAQIMDEAGIELILVGDSLGVVVLGYENTLPVTMAELVHHTRAVARAKPQALIVGDLPFRSYETIAQARENAGLFQQAGADAVKLEGGEAVAERVAALTPQIPVLGHIGLLPQSVPTGSGFRVQGRTAESAEQLLRDAQAIAAAGAFAIVIECTVADVAREITAALKIPTLGIGAGNGCDGQILVSSDMLGQFTRFAPKHAKRYANLADEMRRAFLAYRREVESGEFPGTDHSF